MKVLHGTVNVANQAAVYSRGLCALGIDSTSVDYTRWSMGYPVDLKCVTVDEQISFAETAKEEYDIFHFHWGSTLATCNVDLPALIDKGKALFMNFWGSDCRQWSLARKMNPFIRVKTADEESVRTKLTWLSKYIPVAIVADYELEAYVKPFFDKIIQVPQAIITEDYSIAPTEEHEKPLIVHAPTNPYVKGTNEVIVALNRLTKEGYKFSLRLINGMAHDEAKNIYAQADIIIDSITEGTYGLFAIECMSMGKPVIGWITDEAKAYYKGIYGTEPPMIVANPDTIYDQIRDVLNSAFELEDIGIKGAKYARDNHDYLRVAAVLMGIYDAYL